MDIHKKLKSTYSELKKSHQELKDTHIEMIFRLALMAEVRDTATGAHLVRVADYSAVIAEGLGLPEKEIEIIRYASSMHDVGKIILSDSILGKKDKLTPKEKTLVKEHAKVGADIFKSAKASMMKACGVIAMTHHERYDGAGYPNGLMGEEIPLYGRVVALADCFDAFTSKRPYKKAFSFNKSFEMMKERAGTHFDPILVDVFLDNKEKIRKIWEANRDISSFLKEMGI